LFGIARVVRAVRVVRVLRVVPCWHVNGSQSVCELNCMCVRDSTYLAHMHFKASNHFLNHLKRITNWLLFLLVHSACAPLLVFLDVFLLIGFHDAQS
jgi:hypothetical protein